MEIKDGLVLETAVIEIIINVVFFGGSGVTREIDVFFEVLLDLIDGAALFEVQIAEFHFGVDPFARFFRIAVFEPTVVVRDGNGFVLFVFVNVDDGGVATRFGVTGGFEDGVPLVLCVEGGFDAEIVGELLVLLGEFCLNEIQGFQVRRNVG